MNAPLRIVRRFSLTLLFAMALALPGSVAHAALLYWIDTNFGAPTINSASTGGTGVASFAAGAATLPEGLAAWNDGRLIWTEAAWSNARLRESAWDVSGMTTMVSGLAVMRGIAVDNTNHDVFWTTSNLATGSAVYRMTLNGNPAILVTLPAGANPRGIAVDPVAAKIFWADYDLNAIYKSNLDGTGVSVIVSLAAGSGPWGMAINTSAQRIYWTEYGTGRLMRADYLGTNQTALEMGLLNPTYLAVDFATSFIFWVDAGAVSQKLKRCGINGGAVTILPPAVAAYGGIAVGTGTVSAVNAEAPVAALAMARPWPNPGAGAIHLAYTLPHPAAVHLSIFDVQGREVAILADEAMPTGRHEVTWDGSVRGTRAPAGIYFARLAVEGVTRIERLVLTP